jgi:hypothetical protein
MAKVLTDSEIMKWKREAMLRREMARNPIVFLDVSMGDDLSNRMIFEVLFFLSYFFSLCKCDCLEVT